AGTGRRRVLSSRSLRCRLDPPRFARGRPGRGSATRQRRDEEQRRRRPAAAARAIGGISAQAQYTMFELTFDASGLAPRSPATWTIGPHALDGAISKGSVQSVALFERTRFFVPWTRKPTAHVNAPHSWMSVDACCAWYPTPVRTRCASLS